MISKKDLQEIKLIKTKNKITIDDEFDLAEQLGRLNFIGWCSGIKPCQYVSSNKDKFGGYDVEILWRDEPALVEIKYRIGYTSKDFDTWYLEEYKLNKLKDENKDGKYKLLYYNLFSDFNSALWDITDLNSYHTTDINLQKTNINKETRLKPTILLDINKAVKTF